MAPAGPKTKNDEFIRQTRQSCVEKKNMAMSPAGSEAKNDCAGKGQLQFT